MKTQMGKFNEGELGSPGSLDRDAFQRDSAGSLWEEMQVGEYHIWLRGGSHAQTSWEYGFQHQPQDRPHGPLMGPIFEESPPQLPFDFYVVKAMALEAVRADGLKIK